MNLPRIALVPVAFLVAIALVWTYLGPIQRLMIPVSERILSKAVLRLPAAPGDRFVVLTIDDAPSSRTKEILDLLEQHNARATFFVHGNQIAGREAAIERLAADGHDIGHHMWRDRPAIWLSTKDFDNDFAQTEAALGAYGDAARPYFRPPYGAYRASAMDATLSQFGYNRPLADLGSARRYILASFIPWDAGGATNSCNEVKNRRAARRYNNQLLTNLYPGAIVVFHDGEEKGRKARLATTLYSLALFLEGAKARNYEVLSLSEAVARAAEE